MPTRTTKRLTFRAALGATAAALTLAAAPSAEAAPTRLVAAGLGTAGVTASHAVYSGELTGDPYSGAFSGRVDSYDGSLPSVGLCEPGTATLEVTDAKGRGYSLWASGKVCAIYLPLGVMQRFEGRYVVQEASRRGLVDTSGVLDIRLLGNQSDVYALG